MNQILIIKNWLLLLTLFLVTTLALQAQDTFLARGQVLSAEDGQPLPGASVTISGTATGTATDFDGKFELSTKIGDKLTCSFIGYTTQTIDIADKKNIIIKLIVSGAHQLSDVVVVGYGVTKKSHLTGSVAKLEDEGLDQNPVSRADQALVGKLSGVEIATTDASAGATPKVLIRGISSISAGTSPLIVVDGFPIPGDLSSIDMNDVASIEVLKDAASAAIYGSRGANGVIMVTTKGGKKGKLSISANIIQGVKTAYKRNDLYPTPSEWNTRLRAQNITDPSGRAELMEKIGTATDWQDEIFRTGSFSKYQMGATGGGEWGNFYIGGSYLKDKGVVLTDNYEKFSIRANVNAKLNSFIDAGMQVTGNTYDRRRVAVGLQDALRNQPWLPSVHTKESIVALDAEGIDVEDLEIGDYAHERDFGALRLTSNNSALTKVLGRENMYKGYETFANSFLKIKVTKDLHFKTSLGAYYSTNQREWFQTSWGHRKGLAEVNSTYFNNQKTSVLNENTLNYSKRFGKHDIKLLAGATYQEDHRKYLEVDGKQYANDLIHTLNAAGTVEIDDHYERKSVLISGLFRAIYSFNDRYLFSASMRRDGSSRFGSNSRWGTFPAVSLGWRVSEEDFMKNIELISSLKLRATYGTTGNNSIPDYMTISNLSPASAIAGGVQNGFAASNIANPNLGWERTVETNLGIDLGILDNRFNLSANYYMTTKDQLLLELPVPSVTGFTSAWKNVGQLKTNGIEIDLNTVNIDTENFKWSTRINFSHNANELVDFGGVEQQILTPDSKRPTQWIVQVGGPLTQFYGYEVERELTAQEMKTPAYPVNVSATHAYVKDQNNDGTINDKDRVVLGNPYPDFIWGMTNEFKYKNFDLSVMFNGSQGAKTANTDRYYFESQWKGAYNPETVSNKDALVVKSNTGIVIQDASYISLRNITIGYTSPKNLASKVGMSSFRVFVSGQNLLYFMGNDYSSFNPEAQNWNTTSSLTAGGQRGGMPMTRTVSVGLNLTF